MPWRRILAFVAATTVGLSAKADGDWAAQQMVGPAMSVLKTYCAGCHGGDAFGTSADEAGFDFILDRERLVAKKKIIPGQPMESKLFVRILKMEMPPREVTKRPTAAEIEALRQWIAIGAPATASNTPASRRDFISLDNVERLIFEDLNTTDEEVRPNIRYFMLTHAWNAGLPEPEIESRRHALSKLLNGLTWSSKIVVPKAIDPHRTIFRVDLRDLKWDVATWDAIVARYPYAIARSTMIGKAIYDTMKTGAPYARADWFVAEASHPPLYDRILSLPEKATDLESQLGVDVSADILAHKSLRAGFSKSGISRNNRLIERHETRNGAYWKSYDFANNETSRNLFQHPIGPALNSESFEPDGGEIIFSLPNGFHGYMLVNSSGNRLSQAPTEIVSDPGRPDRRVENGLSCMGCHTDGIISKEDEIRSYMEKTPAGLFNDAVRNEVLALYPPKKAFLDLQSHDRDRYLTALLSGGVSGKEKEPVSLCARAFEQELDLATAAAELGVSESELRTKMNETPKSFAPLTPLLGEGVTLRRTVFLSGFKDAVVALKLGKPVGGDALVTRTESPAMFCGTDGPVSSRIEGCRLLVGADEIRAPGWTLVSVKSGVNHVWRNDAGGLLWSSPTTDSVTREIAGSFCSEQASRHPITGRIESVKWRLPNTDELRSAVTIGLLKLPGWQTFEGTFWLAEQQTMMWTTKNFAMSAGDGKLRELGSYERVHVVCVATDKAGTAADARSP